MKGVYSSGGSTANLVALGAARQWALNQRGIDPAASGLRDDRLGIYSSARTHHTIQRSAGVLGIGRRNVRLVAVDDDERMDLDALRAALQTDAADGVVPVAVVAAAGTAERGLWSGRHPSLRPPADSGTSAAVRADPETDAVIEITAAHLR